MKSSSNYQPKIKPEKTKNDFVLETAAVVILIAIWGMAAYALTVLPETFPVHFDLSGRPDGYGGKGSLLILPATALFLYAGMTILNRYPHVFNYPVKLTAENALRQYTNATRAIRVLKLIVMLVFFLIAYFQVQSALTFSSGIGIWLLPLILLLVYLPLGYFIIKAFRKK